MTLVEIRRSIRRILRKDEQSELPSLSWTLISNFMTEEDRRFVDFDVSTIGGQDKSRTLTFNRANFEAQSPGIISRLEAGEKLVATFFRRCGVDDEGKPIVDKEGKHIIVRKVTNKYRLFT